MPSRRQPLTKDRIVNSALDLARREGIGGLSMRRLAGELGVEPMSLYHHIPSKAALMLHMADRSVSEIPQPDATQPWDRQLVDLLTHTFQAAVHNPALFPVLAVQPSRPGALPSEPDSVQATVALLELILALLEKGEVPESARVNAFRGLIGVVVGFAVEQVDGLLPLPPAEDTPEPPAGNDPIGQAPLLRTLFPALQASDPLDAVRFSLELFIHGLRTLPQSTLTSSDE